MAYSGWKWLAGAACTISCALAQTTVLYETTFETSEGYDPNKNLAGQRSWVAEGTGGNGLIDGLFLGLGQQAYVGFLAPTDTNSFTTVWRPVDFDPAPANQPLVHFSVIMQVVPSTAGPQDDFRWSIYNIAGDRLFSIDFETSTGKISYVLQDGQFVFTGSSINFDGTYDLDVWMDFRRNLWSAFLNDYLIVNSQPLTQNNSPLSFGDADAVWFLRGATGAGNNYMAFDNYRITAESLAGIPGYLEAPRIDQDGFVTFRAFGEKGVTYSVDVTSDFVQWMSLGQYAAGESGFDFTDNTAKGFARGFYRLRPIP